MDVVGGPRMLPRRRTRVGANTFEIDDFPGRAALQGGIPTGSDGLPTVRLTADG